MGKVERSGLSLAQIISGLLHKSHSSTESLSHLFYNLDNLSCYETDDLLNFILWIMSPILDLTLMKAAVDVLVVFSCYLTEKPLCCAHSLEHYLP